MKRTRNPDEKIERILTAAKQILADGGYLTRFSLSTVAAEAEVSKGGLLHHFPSKEALLRSIAKDLIDDFEDQLDLELEKEKEGRPGRFTRAYISAALSTSNAYDPISPVLLAFLRYSAEGEEIQSRFQAFQLRLEQDGIDSTIANIVRMAVDGMLYTEIIDAEPIEHSVRQKMVEQLIQMTYRNYSNGHRS
ncbi:MAG: TetR/AcrR family transcriptional regulator [Chloroflexota bacterium]